MKAREASKAMIACRLVWISAQSLASTLGMQLVRFSNDPRTILEYHAAVGKRYVIRALRLHAMHANDAGD